MHSPRPRRSHQSEPEQRQSYTSTRSLPPELARSTYSGIQSGPGIWLAISNPMQSASQKPLLRSPVYRLKPCKRLGHEIRILTGPFSAAAPTAGQDHSFASQRTGLHCDRLSLRSRAQAAFVNALGA
jgi:hypothetical protein